MPAAFVFEGDRVVVPPWNWDSRMTPPFLVRSVARLIPPLYVKRLYLPVDPHRELCGLSFAFTNWYSIDLIWRVYEEPRASVYVAHPGFADGHIFFRAHRLPEEIFALCEFIGTMDPWCPDPRGMQRVLDGARIRDQ